MQRSFSVRLGPRHPAHVADPLSLSAPSASICPTIGPRSNPPCRHIEEGQGIEKKALADGALDSKRYESYLKLQKEKKFLEMQKDYRLIRRTRRDWQKKVLQIVEAKNELKKKGLL